MSSNFSFVFPFLISSLLLPLVMSPFNSPSTPSPSSGVLLLPAVSSLSSYFSYYSSSSSSSCSTPTTFVLPCVIFFLVLCSGWSLTPLTLPLLLLSLIFFHCYHPRVVLIVYWLLFIRRNYYRKHVYHSMVVFNTNYINCINCILIYLGYYLYDTIIINNTSTTLWSLLY